MAKSDSPVELLKRELRHRLVTAFEGSLHDAAQRPTQEQLESRLRALTTVVPHRVTGVALTPDEMDTVIEQVASEVLGFGPIATLMDDPTVSEIMVNGPHQVFVERAGRVEPTAIAFESQEHLLYCIERLMDMVGASITEAEPFVDASLPDGSRLNVVLPPIVLGGPAITIRKALKPFSLDEWMLEGSLTQLAANFLMACVAARVNIVVSGGTSTGKTTLVNLLSSYVPKHERIITIENVAELHLSGKEHWVRLIARPPNVEGRGEISIRDLVKNALRMRPDRIILGEARSGEALDMIQAMHTGHEGFFTVIHANSPEASLDRLETLMLMSGIELPSYACKVQIATAIELIVHLRRYPDGQRRIAQITQVMGLDEHGFVLEDLFRFESNGLNGEGLLQGELRYTGKLPKFFWKFETANISLPEPLRETNGVKPAAAPGAPG